MAGYSTGGSTHQPPNHPPPQYHHSAATYTQAAATAAPPPIAKQENHARVRSYDSFKRIIEGPTFHPAHSRESSQASTGSGENRSPRKSAHSHTGSRDSAHSLTQGRTPPHYSSPGRTPQGSNDETFGNSTGHSHQGYLNYGQSGRSRHEDSSYNARQQYDRTYVSPPRTETTPSKPTNIQANRETYPNSHQPRTATRFFSEEEIAGGYEGGLASVHQMRRGVVDRSHPKPPPPSDRPTQGYPPSYHHHLQHHPRPEPDGEDSNSAPHPTHDPPPYHSHHHQNNHTRISAQSRERSPPGNSRPKLQRQHGIHIKEEVPIVHKPRPKTEYLDRSGVYEEPPVLMRDRSGRDGLGGIGYVNSAYIEESSPDLGLSDEEAEPYIAAPQRQHHYPEQSEYSQAIRNAQNHSRPSSHLPMGSDGQRGNASSYNVKVQVEGPLHREPMKRTVGEAMKEKEEQVQMRRHYVQHKHRSDSGRQHTEHRDRFRFSQIETNSQNRPYARISNPAQSQTHNSAIGANPTPSVPQRSSQPLHRPLSVSPDRKRQRRFNPSDIQHGGVQPEVGLQSFVHRDTDSKSPGAAIMVHMAPPSEKQRNNSGATSPVIINVGEMTWERLKRQVSKKNIYVVQQKEKEVKVRTKSSSRSPTKPRTHFTLSLFTMCFCLSPLGFLAMIFAVCSASAYKDKQPDSGRCLSKVALVLSIIGIVGSLATVAILIWTNTLPMIGRYSEPEGN